MKITLDRNAVNHVLNLAGMMEAIARDIRRQVSCDEVEAYKLLDIEDCLQFGELVQMLDDVEPHIRTLLAPLDDMDHKELRAERYRDFKAAIARLREEMRRADEEEDGPEPDSVHNVPGFGPISL